MDQKTMLKILGPAAAIGLLILLVGIILMPPGQQSPTRPAAPAGSDRATAEQASSTQVPAGEETAGTTLTLPPLEDPAWKDGPEGGMKTWDVLEGTGDTVPANASVKVHYTGWLTNGSIFDSSVKRNESIEFSLNGVIRGWTVGIPGMKVGGIRRLYIPAPLAYGNRSQSGIPANSTLVFEVKLLGFTK